MNIRPAGLVLSPTASCAFGSTIIQTPFGASALWTWRAAVSGSPRSCTTLKKVIRS